ncbi:Ubiquitin carboxyl-terminal hydrolase 34 [Orbilia brochopaga]
MNHQTINGTHFDGLNNPTPPRRPSYEDDDTDPARPRKRPATLATVELLSAECMSAQATNSRGDVNMANGSPLAEEDASSEHTMPNDDTDAPASTAQVSAAQDDNAARIDSDNQNTLKSDDSQISPDSEGSSPIVGDSDGVEEEYKNTNYVISNADRDSSGSVPMLEEEEMTVSQDSQESGYQTFETVILPTLRPHTYSENDGRAFFVPMYSKIGNDLSNTVSALRELYPCVAVLSNSDSPEKFNQVHNEGLHAWRYLPQVMASALKRSPSLGLIFSTQPLRPGTMAASALLFKTFRAFFKVALRMVQYDLDRMTNLPSSAAHRPFSTTFIGVAADICRIQPVGMPHNYTDESKAIVTDLWSDIMTLTLDEPYGFEIFKEYLDAVLERLPRQPDLMEALRQLFRFPSAVLKITAEMSAFDDASVRQNGEIARTRVTQQCYDICLLTQKRLKGFINDTFLESKEDFNALVDCSAHLLNETVAMEPGLIDDNSEFQLAVDFSLYPMEFRPLIADACLRMTIYDLALRKCKKLEVRLHALTTICNELLEVWKKRNMKREDPLLRCIAFFIRTSGLVEYILGPHSHFQLIQKASNVVGFLIVMGDFDRHFLEVVWQPIIAVRDQREVHATIALLQDLCHNMTLSNHYDSCKVLCNAPVNAWDEALTNYLDRVLAEIKGHGQHGALPVEIAPYNLLIRLFGLSFDILASSPSAAFTNYLAAKFDWLYTWLGDLLLYGPQIQEKKELIGKCVTAMEQGLGYKATDLYILNAVLESFPSDTGIAEGGVGVTIGQEIVEMDLISLLVRQTILCVESQTTFESLYQDLHPIFKLLRLVMLHTPDLIQTEHASQLWLVLCGENSRDPRVRNCSFGFFSDFLSQPSSIDGGQTNTFMRALFKEYFPEMRPELFVPSVLDFCKHAVVYFNPNLESQMNENLELLQIDGIDQVWRIVTTAPQDEIAHDAINYLVHVFADQSETPSYSGNTLLTKINCDLVNISIKELGEAASSLQIGPTSDPSITTDSPTSQSALKFRRSLLVLQELLEVSPPTGNIIQKARSFEYPGLEEELSEILTISFQGYAPKYQAQKCDITVPASTSGKDFYAYIGAVTGLQNFRVICAGRELFLAETVRSLTEIGLQNESFMILQSRTTPINIAGLTTNEAVRREVQKHFAELCQLLTLPDEYSEKIWRLVARFPPPEDRYSEIKDELVNTPIESTTSHPFKLLYALAIVKAALFNTVPGSMDLSTVDPLNEWTSKTLISFDVTKLRAAYSQTEVVHALLECLLLLIPHISGLQPPANTSHDTVGLVTFLLALLTDFQGSMAPEDGKVCIRAFRALLAICIQDSVGLDLVVSDGRFPALLRSFLLEDPREYMRKEVSDAVVLACHDACTLRNIDESAGASPHRAELALHIWKALYDLIPHTLERAPQSLMAFEATSEVFGMISRFDHANVKPALYFSDWCGLLLKHRCQESIDYLTQDNVVYGLSHLMMACISAAKGYSSSWIPHENLAQLLQQQFLFPPLTGTRDSDPEAMDLGETSEAIVLTSPSRRQLNSLTTMVLQSLPELDSLVGFLRQVLSEAAPGLPSIYSIDRSRWLRSDAGHVGLRNLSNTCYLNSLLTQLFMNLPFREFILQAKCETIPPNPLSTLQIVFANLQNSWQKAFEPKDFVATIRDYDGDLIDVGIQMDVEEFYNLLCDRIESQITPADAKKDFRAFFGGTFVQQVKSMECEHVSEREEQFSAIQCDIKGKKNLQESLKAYVEGETLNGDNKYSCTNCNRHVDAVKRTCLKQIPNQVIFHLKRFEFDLRTMNRSKINDAFEFPTRIDLHPYSMDAANQSQDDAPKTDEFELVGVLVHSGTAETGHYYSYIKDREGKFSDGMPLWFEFNDSEVTTFDPSTIPSSCFGGPDTLPSKDGLLGHSYMKPFSAYMLFYERVASQAQQPSPPVGIEVDLGQEIFNENEQALRRYCLFDPSHLDFMAKLLQRLQALNGGCCTEHHILETKMLCLFLDTFEQIAIKIKDCEQTIDMLTVLSKAVKSCRLCCRSLLEWLRIRQDLLRNILLRCFIPKVRQEFGNLVIFALQNMESPRSNSPIKEPDQEMLVDWIISECGDYFEYLGYHMRAWDDYFGFLRSLAEMSSETVVQLVNAGFLKRCLDILMIEYVLRPTKIKYGSLARFVDKGRKMLHSGLLDFIGTLLDHCDLQNPVGEVDDDDEEEDCRPNVDGQGIPITKRELQLLRYALKKNGLYIVYKPLDISANIKAVNRILKKLVMNEPNLGTLQDIVKALHATVAVDPAHLAEPALQAIIVFLENVRLAAEVRDMVRRIAQEVKTIGAHGGVEHLSFFKTAFAIRNPNFGAHFIPNQVTENAKIWSPPLLTYHDEAVRSATEDFLMRNLIGDIPQQSERVRSHQKEYLRELGNHSVAWIDNKFVRSRNPMRDDSRLTNILRILEHCCEAIDDTPEDQELKLKVDNIRDSVDRLVIVEEDEPSDLANSDTGSLTQEIDLLDNDYSSN